MISRDAALAAARRIMAALAPDIDEQGIRLAASIIVNADSEHDATEAPETVLALRGLVGLIQLHCANPKTPREEAEGLKCNHRYVTATVVLDKFREHA